MTTADPSTRCRVCGEDAAGERLSIREMMFGWREAFAYHRCPSCESLSIAVIPADLSRFYPPDYYANRARMDIVQDPAWRRLAIRLLVGRHLFRHKSAFDGLARRVADVPVELELVEPFIVGGALASFDDAILDVGCGSMPTRLAILRKLGFRRLLGIEPYIPRDTRYQGVPVQRGDLSAVDGRFQLIMFHHSFEHVTDPFATLRQVRERLATDGRLLIRTPIVGGHFWREYGTDWVELDAPRHIIVASMVGLQRLAERAGFEVIDTHWETGDWEFIASEQYRRDIGMYEAASWFSDPTNGAFDASIVAGYRAAARRLNAAGDAGRAAVWLRPVGR